MAAPNSLQLAAAPGGDPAAQRQAAVTALQSPRGAYGFAAAAPKQGATMLAPPSPQGAPGFAVVPQGGAHAAAAAPGSPQGPPGFWLPPQQGTPAPPQGAPVMAQPQGATMVAPQQQHFAHVLVPGSQQGMQMAVQAASMGMMMSSMSQQAQAQAMAVNQQAQGMAQSQSAALPMMQMQQAQAQAMAAQQQAQGMAASQSLATCPLFMMQMQQAQAGHMMVTPPLPHGPPPLMQQLSQADPAMMTPPPLPLGHPPAMLQQQPAQGGSVMMMQPSLPFSPPSVLLQQHSQGQGNQMMMGQPQLSALPRKRQRVDQCDNPYGQHTTGHQLETAIFNAAMGGQSFGSNLPNEFASFVASMPSLPKDATSTIYVDGLPPNTTRREVAHIFRQYMGYREVRLVNKGSSRHICFVDFATPAHAFLAMRTLQGYKFDEQDHHSRSLNLQFSHSPRMVGPHGRC